MIILAAEPQVDCNILVPCHSLPRGGLPGVAMSHGLTVLLVERFYNDRAAPTSMSLRRSLAIATMAVVIATSLNPRPQLLRYAQVFDELRALWRELIGVSDSRTEHETCAPV